MSFKVYYTRQDESASDNNRLIPAPQLSISPEFYYANDNVIGYTYNITITGYAMAKESSQQVDYGLSPTIDSIAKIRNIFDAIGGNLYIKDETNIDRLVAKGGTIKTIEFGESDNKWVNYAPFTVEIEFNEVDFKGCENNPIIPCNGSIFHTGQTNTTPIISDHFIDLKKYKVKELTDKWTFNIDDQIYQSGNIINVSYDLSATGKNYYVGGKLVPAWQQARLFVQDKLYKQVKSLISGSLQIVEGNDSACASDKTLTNIHEIINNEGGLFKNFSTPTSSSPGTPINYDIYNETIECNASESDGTFSIGYKATLKKYDLALTDQQNAALHSYTMSVSTSSEQSIEATINVKGTIQGLVRGGFIYTQGTAFTLPSSGTLITSADSAETKYGNALSYFYSQVGNKIDLLLSMKQKLNITKGQLLIKSDDYMNVATKPSSFVLDHNYHDGTVSYTANYDRATCIANDNGYTNVSITRTDPIEMIQEFVIPGRAEGPIIQKLGMKTPRTVSINIDGADERNRGCIISDPCAGMPYTSLDADFNSLLEESNEWVKTKEDYTVNKLDGSFSISLEYILRDCY